MVFGDKVFGRQLGLYEVMRIRPLWWNQCPCKKTCHSTCSLTLSLSLSCEHTKRKQPPISQEENLHQTCPHWHPDLRTVRNTLLLFTIHYYPFFSFYAFFSFLKNFYWGIVALQCCVSFYCTAKWISSVYTYIQRRRWHPTPVLLPRESHGWRSLVGCSPWGR